MQKKGRYRVELILLALRNRYFGTHELSNLVLYDHCIDRAIATIAAGLYSSNAAPGWPMSSYDLASIMLSRIAISNPDEVHLKISSIETKPHFSLHLKDMLTHMWSDIDWEKSLMATRRRRSNES
jgi:hypothetical protein